MSKRWQNYAQEPSHHGLTIAIIGQLGFATDGNSIAMTLLCGKEGKARRKRDKTSDSEA